MPGRSAPATPRAMLLSLLIAPHVMGSINLAAIAAMAPLIKQDLGLSLAEIGLLSTAYTVCQGAAGLPSGIAVDRLGIGWTILLGFVFLAGGAAVFGQAGGYMPCLIGAGIMGVGYACMNPATAKAVFDWFPRNRRGTVMGLKQTGVPIGWTLGAFALPLAAIFDWHTVMLVIAGAGLASGLVYLPMAKRPVLSPGQKRPALTAEFGELLRNRPLAAIELNTFLYHAAQPLSCGPAESVFLHDAVLSGSPARQRLVCQFRAATGPGRQHHRPYRDRRDQ